MEGRDIREGGEDPGEQRMGTEGREEGGKETGAAEEELVDE